MIRLKAYAYDQWFCRDFRNLAEVRHWWWPRTPAFGILELAWAEPATPVPWQFTPGKLLATEGLIERYAPRLKVSRHPDGSLPLVVDKLFAQNAWRDLPVDYHLPPMPHYPPRRPEGYEPPPPPQQRERKPREPRAARPRPPSLPLLDKCYPAWFGETPLASLNLTNLVYEALAPHGTVAGLAPLVEDDICGLPGLGPRMVLRMRSRIDEAYAVLSALRERPPAVEGPDAAEGPSVPDYDIRTPLRDFLLSQLHALPQRDGRILSERMGLAGEPRTLEEIGNDLGVTRERVRQIETKSRERLDVLTGCFDTVGRSLLHIRHDAPVPFGDVLSRPWTDGLSPSCVQNLLSSCADLSVIRVARGEFVVPFGEPVWVGRREALLRMLAESAPPDTTDDVVERFSTWMGNVADRRASVGLAKEYLGDGPVAYAKVRLGMSGAAIADLLPGDGSPIHLHAIADGLGMDVRGDPQGEINLHALLRTKAVHLGAGLFAATPSVLPPGLHALCLGILRSGVPGRRWTTEDLLDRVKAEKPRSYRGLDVLGLERFLCTMVELERVAARRWRIKGSPRADETPESTAEGILDRNGSPMDTVALRRAVEALWGPRVNLQLRAVGRLAIIDDGVWGLSDRDIPIDAERRQAIASAVSEMFASGVANLPDMHAGLGARGLAEGIGQALLATLMRLDAGLRSGSDLTVRRDGSPPRYRPGTLKHAVREALLGFPDGVTRIDLAEAVAARTGSPASLATVGLVLKANARLVSFNLWVPLPPEETSGPPPRPKIPKPRAPRPNRTRNPKPRVRPLKGYPKTRRPSRRSGPAFDWTPERVETLRAMLDDKRSGVEIAKALGNGLTKCAVNAKAFRLGLATPRDRPEPSLA